MTMSISSRFPAKPVLKRAKEVSLEVGSGFDKKTGEKLVFLRVREDGQSVLYTDMDLEGAENLLDGLSQAIAGIKAVPTGVVQ